METTLKIVLTNSQIERLSQIAVERYGSLQSLYEDMITKFLKMAPWRSRPALEWQETKSCGEPGCKMIAINVPSALLELAEDESVFESVTPEELVYTAVVWWTSFVYPPKSSAH